MTLEKNMRKRVVKILKPLDAKSVENGVGAGTPDVNYVEGWIELKVAEQWPVKPETPLRLPHFTAGQKVWLLRRWRAGGKAFLLVKIADDWLMFNGLVAGLKVGSLPRRDMLNNTCWYSLGGLDEEYLLQFLDERSLDVGI